MRRQHLTLPETAYAFPKPLQEGVIVSRPNRFVMLVRSRGRTLRCHCPTTGRIGELELSGLRCLYSESLNPGRKTPYTVEAISLGRTEGGWVGINQTAANRYLEHFFLRGALRLMAAGTVRREVRLGASRIDFAVGDALVEVKTPLITLPAGPAKKVTRSRFDSFERLIRHMNELRESLSSGKRALIVLCYYYDAEPFRPPSENRSNRTILAAAKAAEDAGVERWQVNLRITKDGVSLIRYFRSKPYSTATAR